MLKEKGRLITLYDLKIGHLSICLNGGWGKFKCEMPVGECCSFELTGTSNIMSSLKLIRLIIYKGIRFGKYVIARNGSEKEQQNINM